MKSALKPIVLAVTVQVVMLPFLVSAQNLYVANSGSKTIEEYTNSGGKLDLERHNFCGFQFGVG